MGVPPQVSRSTDSTAKQEVLQREYSNNAKMFDALPSFDAADAEATVTALKQHGSEAFRSGEKSSVFRSRNHLEEPNRRHSRGDTQAQIAHLLDEDNFESSLMDLEQAWKSDPELQMNMTFSRDEGEQNRFAPPNQEATDLLALRLDDMHERIRKGIFAYPEHERPALVSIVAEWARCVARSPLEPFPPVGQGRQGPPQQQPAAIAPTVVASSHHVPPTHRGPPTKTEHYSKPTAAV